MKKYLFALVAAACSLSAAAQTEVLKINLGDQVVTYRIADIKEITFDVEDEKVDTTLFHAFQGYLTVTSAYFTDAYYGNEAELSVFKTSLDEYIVTFSDPTWGEAEFGQVQVGRELSGEGTIKMDNHRGGISEYAATLSGPMTTPVITVPDVMSGLAITFHVGEPPLAYAVSGTHQGDMQVMVGAQFGPYTAADVAVKVEGNSDGTINITVPAYELEGTVMGNLSLGTYTVKNIAYDEERQAFYRDYTADELTMHLTAVKDGQTTMDDDYAFTTLGNIQLTANEDGTVTVVNNFQPGKMPFPIAATFEQNQ